MGQVLARRGGQLCYGVRRRVIWVHRHRRKFGTITQNSNPSGILYPIGLHSRTLSDNPGDSANQFGDVAQRIPRSPISR